MATWIPGAVTGLLLAGWLPALPGIPGATAMGAAGALLAACANPLARFAAGLLLGALLGVGHGGQLLDHRLPVDCVREPLEVEGRVDSLPRVSWFNSDTRQQRFEFALTGVRPSHCAGPRRVLLSYYGSATLAAGDYWRFEAKLRRPWGLVNPGSFNMQAWYAGSGIDATGSARSAGARRLAGDGSVGSTHHRLRARVSEQIDALALSSAARAVLRAVTVADRSGLDAGLWRLFQYYGVNHLLVISGLHIGLLAALGYGLGRALAAGALLAGWGAFARVLPGTVALVLAAGYTALAGFSLATVRALVMLACVVAALWCWRRAGAWSNLLLAALVLLVINPLAGLGSGFWLSFGAVALLLWLALWRRGAGGAWRQRFTLHLYMSLAMVPFTGWWFGGFSLVAAPANLLLVPLLGAWVVPLALLGAMFALAGWDLAGTLWVWAAYPLEWLLPLGAGWAEARPGWLYRPVAPGALETLLALAAACLWVLPGDWRLRLMLPVLLAPLLLPPKQPRTASDDAVHLLALDVGQGTSLVIYDRDHALLYDTGGGVAGGHTLARSVVLPMLRERGVARLDTLVVSHGDSDHSAGLDDVLAALPVGRVLAGVDLADARSGMDGIAACRAGASWRWPERDVRFRVLAPALESSDGLSPNNASCVLQVEVAGIRLLLPGDIDAGRERELVRYWGAQLHSDWLLAAHHGSGSSTSHAWLKAVAPSDVLFTHGYANRFGHPHPAVLARVDRRGMRAWSTARQGAIELVLRPGREAEVITHRALRRRYWL